MGAGTIQIEAAGHLFVLMPQRAVYWPAASTLLVADLHWGKGETLAAGGVPVPRGIMDHDLARLSDAVRVSGASRILVVGDLLHAGIGMVPAMIEQVAAWRASHGIDLALVPGNHDRRLDRIVDAWRVTIHPRVLQESGVTFAHDPSDAPAAGDFTWCGHVHPLVRLRAGGDSLSLPSFIVGRTIGLLPAFSRFTSGAAVAPEPGAGVWAVAEQSVVEITPRASSAPVTARARPR